MKADADESVSGPPAHCRDCRLRALNVFTRTTTREARFIEIHRRRSEVFSRGEMIVREHERAKFLRTIYSGMAFRFKSLPDGRRQILNFLLPGDVIGLQEQFSESSLHGVEALSDVTTCGFQRNFLGEMYGDHPQLAFGVTWVAAREESFVDEHLLSVGRRSAVERIGALYLHLYRRYRQLSLIDESGWFDCPVTQVHISDALGLSLIHTQRSLSKLKRLGLFSRSGAKLRIDNPRVLEKISEYYERPPNVTPLL